MIGSGYTESDFQHVIEFSIKKKRKKSGSKSSVKHIKESHIVPVGVIHNEIIFINTND